MRKFIMMVALAMGLQTSVFGFDITGAVKDQLGSVVGGKISSLSDVKGLLPGNMSNLFSNVSSDVFGGLTSTIFNGLDYVTMGSVSKCYVLEESSSNLDVCSFAKKLDELMQGNFCNLVPSVPGMRKRGNDEMDFDYSLGLYELCKAKQAEYGNIASKSINNMSQSKLDGTPTQRAGRKAAQKYIDEMWELNALLKLNKDSLAYKSASKQDNETIRLMKEFWSNEASNGFKINYDDKGNFKGNITVKKKIQDITIDDIVKVPQNLNAYNEEINAAVELENDKLKSTNPINIAQNAIDKSKNDILANIDGNKVLTAEEINTKIMSETNLKELDSSFENHIVAESEKEIAIYRSENWGLENPDKTYLDKVGSGYKLEAAKRIQKQAQKEVEIKMAVREKYARKKDITVALTTQKAIMAQAFNREVAMEDIRTYINNANDKSFQKDTLGWDTN